MAYWVIFHVCFLSSADIFQNKLFEKVLSGIPSECQTFVRPDLGPNCLPRLALVDKELMCVHVDVIVS